MNGITAADKYGVVMKRNKNVVMGSSVIAAIGFKIIIATCSLHLEPQGW